MGLWFDQKGRGKLSHGRTNPWYQVSTLELTQILWWDLNKPIISFFDYIPITKCMCEVGGNNHLMYLLKHGGWLHFGWLFQLLDIRGKIIGVLSSNGRSNTSCLVTVFFISLGVILSIKGCVVSRMRLYRTRYCH